MANATPKTGLDVLLKVNTGTDVAPVWVAVACQRGATLNRSADTIEASYKGSGAWKTYLQGFKDWSIDCDGLYTFGADEFAGLETAFEGGELVMIEIVDPDDNGFKGSAIITDFPIEAPYDGELTYKVSLQGSGALVAVVAGV